MNKSVTFTFHQGNLTPKVETLSNVINFDVAYIQLVLRDVTFEYTVTQLYTLFRLFWKKYKQIWSVNGGWGAQLGRCSTSVSTISVALMFPVSGMSRTYLNSVHSIAFKWKTSVKQYYILRFRLSLTVAAKGYRSLLPPRVVAHCYRQGLLLTVAAKGCCSLLPPRVVAHYCRQGLSLTVAAKGCRSLLPPRVKTIRVLKDTYLFINCHMSE